MPNLQITVHDGNTGKPLKGTLVHGKMTAPGLFLGVGAQDLTVTERTNENGLALVTISELANYNYDLVADANGYHSDKKSGATGVITGDAGVHFQLKPVSIQSLPDPGSGWFADISSALGGSGQELKALGFQATIVVVVIIIAVVIGIVALAYMFGPGSIAGAAGGK